MAELDSDEWRDARTSVAQPLESELGAMLDATRRCLGQHVDALANDRAGALPRTLLGHAADLGLFGMSIPEHFGGLGLGLSEICHVIAEVAYFDRSLATCVGLHNGLGAWPLITLGTDAQRERWLPRLARGASVAAFAATEAKAGSDLASVATRLDVADEGLVLNGEKQYVTNGALADVYTVLSRVAGTTRRYQLICVPRGTPGVVVGPEERKLGIRASSTTPLRFDDARLERSALLGADGLRNAYDALGIGRTVMSAGCVGTARRAFDHTLEHVGLRRQFRRPIAVFSATRTHVASMAASLFAMESIVEYVGARHRAGACIDSVSTAAKVLCSESAFEITDRALQLHGAMGMMEDTGVALLARDCRVTRIFEGANDVLLALLGSELLSMPESGAARRAHSASHEDARWQAADTLLEYTCAELRRTLGVRIIERQDLLHLVARAHVALMAASAATWRRQIAPGLADFAATHWTNVALDVLDGREEADAQYDATAALTEQLYAHDRLSGRWPGET